jgi:hypothetical protein
VIAFLVTDSAHHQQGFLLVMQIQRPIHFFLFLANEYGVVQTGAL